LKTVIAKMIINFLERFRIIDRPYEMYTMLDMTSLLVTCDLCEFVLLLVLFVVLQNK